MKPLPFNQAIEFFRSKSALPADRFAALAKQLGGRANSLAFTVGGVVRADVLTDILAEVNIAIADGSTFGEWRERLDSIMQKRGWKGPNPYRLDNLFRTNIQSAYNVGRYRQMQEIAEQRPYWEYDAVNDSATRPSHAAQDGKVYHHLHPFWQTWYPPNGYRCRCKVNSISRDEMEEEGLSEETAGTDIKPDAGFDFNPAKESWSPDLQKYAAGLREKIEKELSV